MALASHRGTFTEPIPSSGGSPRWTRQILRQKFGLYKLPTATLLLSELGLGRGWRRTNALGPRWQNPLNPVLDVAFGVDHIELRAYNHDLHYQRAFRCQMN
jgi:hypothetical protein